MLKKIFNYFKNKNEKKIKQIYEINRLDKYMSYEDFEYIYKNK